MGRSYMKLSLAIREGCKKTSEAHGVYTSCDRRGSRYAACAIGAAYWGANGTPNADTVENAPLSVGMVAHLRRVCGPIVRQIVEIPTVAYFLSGMDNGKYNGKTCMPMWAAIEYLFEGANWTRQQVADFVASYEEVS